MPVPDTYIVGCAAWEQDRFGEHLLLMAWHDAILEPWRSFVRRPTHCFVPSLYRVRMYAGEPKHAL